MAAAETPPLLNELIAGLEAAGTGRAAQVAILWTWLEHHLGVLGSLVEKHPQICRTALARESFTELTDEDRNQLAATPVRTAAEILARINLDATTRNGPPTVTASHGISGEAVLVHWRNPTLAKAICDSRGTEIPPSAQQAPSLETIAPRLSVSRVTVDGLTLHPFQPEGEGWEASRDYLDRAMLDESLEVHLDPLVTGSAGTVEDPHHQLHPPLLAGSSGWRYEDGGALLLDSHIEPDDAASCVAAAQLAVERASGGNSVLVMPELAATAAVEDAIIAAIREQKRPPALTVVGLRHRERAAVGLDRSLIGLAQVASHVNEAVIFDAAGNELWRHRKLSCAQAHRGFDDTVVEMISLGDTITIVDTPLGTMALAICLDVFEKRSRDRLARSPIGVLLVPSLSQHVRRHRTSLEQIVQELWGVAFVCNRGFAPDATHPTGWRERDNQSFWAVQREDPYYPAPELDEHSSFVFRFGTTDEKLT